jgi:hypothetical protein
MISHLLGQMFHASDFAGLMLEIMDFAGIAFLDHLLPSTWNQLAKIPQDGLVFHRLFYHASLGRSPSDRDGVGRINVRVQVQGHLKATPGVQAS